MAKKEELTYEEAIKRLEDLIDKMESGDIPLTELVSKFEEGSNLLKLCREQLAEAEMKVEKLNLKTGGTDPFPLDESNS